MRYWLASVLLFTAVETSVLALPKQAAPPPPAVTAQPQASGPFAAEIAAFEAVDRERPPLPGGVLFVGSSSIRLWTTLARDFPELPVINRGFGGSQIADSVRYADRIVLPYHAKMIVMYAGTNDIAAGKSPARILQDFQAFVDLVFRSQPGARIVYISINPSVARWRLEPSLLEANRLIRRYIRRSASRSRKLSFINSHARLLGADGKPRPEILIADGLHLNAQGYKEWTAIVRPQILALWRKDTGKTAHREEL